MSTSLGTGMFSLRMQLLAHVPTTPQKIIRTASIHVDIPYSLFATPSSEVPSCPGGTIHTASIHIKIHRPGGLPSWFPQHRSEHGPSDVISLRRRCGGLPTAWNGLGRKWRP